MPSDEEKKPRIISDEGWKEQARREKEKLREQEHSPAAGAAASARPGGADKEKTDREQAAPSGGEMEGLGPPSFLSLIQTLRLQILYHLGFLTEPGAKDAEVNLEFAQYHIDLLDILLEKTRGNLSGEEENFLGRILHEVHMAYVQVVSAPPPPGSAEFPPDAAS